MNVNPKEDGGAVCAGDCLVGRHPLLGGGHRIRVSAAAYGAPPPSGMGTTSTRPVATSTV